MHRISVSLSILLASSACLVPAQQARYELGRRLRAFEQTWNAVDDVSRARASADLNAATMAFFALDLGGAARRLDAARFALLDPAPPDAAVQAATAWACVPAARLLDAGDQRLRVRLEPMYATDTEASPDLRVVLQLERGGEPLEPARESTLSAAAAGVDLELPAEGEGASTLRCSLRLGARELAGSAQTIERVRDLAARVQALTAASAGEIAPGDHDGATLRYLARRVDAAARGRVAETDLPYLRFLQDAEAIVQAKASGGSFVATSPRGEHWLCLQLGGRSVPVRIHAPPADEASSPRPLLLLLHGAGGSENMFFDAYGAGTYVTLAQERGWVVAAPGNAGAAVGGVLRTLASLYPIDPARVYLVGHSMGAMQAIGAATADPASFAAVAALGGGGRIARGAALAGRRYFVGTGADDFARTGALSLHAALGKAGAVVQLHDYPGTEHLGVVQRAAGDVFDWLDAPESGK